MAGLNDQEKRRHGSVVRFRFVEGVRDFVEIMKLFGREQELAVIEGSFSISGGHRLLLIRGDPGSGKSALVEAAVQLASTQTILRISGSEALRTVGLAASMPMVTQLVSKAERESLLAQLVEGSTHSPILPIQIFEATSRSLEEEEVSIFIDDVQWLDDLSLGLLLYLLRNGRQPFFVLAASRPGRAASFFLEAVEKSGVDAMVLELGPLDEADGVKFVITLRPDLDREAARAICQRARGLPYWIIALSRDRDPTSGHELLTSQVDGADQDSIGLLGHLAVLGRSISIEDVSRLLDWSASRLESAVIDLESKGMLRLRFDHVELVHDLIRETALLQLPDETKESAHRRIARFLEKESAGRPKLMLEALHHRLEAGLPAHSQALAIVKSPRWLPLGEEGLANLGRAADQDGQNDDQAAELRRSVAQMATELGSAEMASRRWLVVFQRSTEATERAWAACQISRLAFRSEKFVESRRWLEIARKIRPVDDLNEIEILTLEAELLMYAERRQDEGHPLAERALAFVDATPLMQNLDSESDGLARSASVRMDVLQACYDSAMISADQSRSVEVASMMIEAARSEVERLVAVGNLGRALLRVGQPLEARSSLEGLWQDSHGSGLVSIMARFGHAYAASLFETGLLERAGEVAAEVAPVAERLGLPRPASFAREASAVVRLMSGDWQTGLDLLKAEMLREQDPHFRFTLQRRVAVYLSRTMRAKAADEVGLLLGEGWESASLVDCDRCISEFTVAAAEASARTGRSVLAEKWLARFEEIGVRPNPYTDAYYSLAEALITKKPGPIEVIGKRFSIMGYEVEKLWIELDIADVRAAQPGRHQAAESYRRAAEQAHVLGAVTIQQMAEKSLRGMGVRTWRRTGKSVIFGFTERELEVAKVAASGSSNREIADSLFLSTKTVERHLSNIFAKAGVRNRVELAHLLMTRKAAQ